MAEKLNKILYPENWGFVREPARPVDLRVLDFDKTYDFNTLWNDIIQINQNTILLIGPPLYNTVNFLQNNCKFTDNSGNLLPWRHQAMDRVDYIIIESATYLDRICLHDRETTHLLPVSYPRNDFLNKKVIVTISKNHPISWLQQWIHYHKTIHNIEGYLIYNNQSTDYTSDELESQLSRHDVTVRIIDYDVPFGTMGGGLWEWQGKSGTTLPWDSDFSQYVMLEHAKWRYLHSAKLAINADTDELLILKNNSLDQIANYCSSSSNSVWLYKGVWIEPVNSVSGQIANELSFNQRHFKNYYHSTFSNQRGIGIKWMLNPAKNLTHQWMLHKTTGPHMMTDEILFGHYMAMNTSWSWTRDIFSGDSNQLTEITELKQNLQKAF